MDSYTREQFIHALDATTSAIQLLNCERQKVGDLTHEQALACFDCGQYLAGGRRNRVRYMQALNRDASVPVIARAEEVPVPVRDSSFWEGRHLWAWTAKDFGKHHPRGLDGLPA